MDISGSTDSINTKVTTWLDSANNNMNAINTINSRENLNQTQDQNKDCINISANIEETNNVQSSPPRRPSILLNNPDGNITCLLKPPKPPRGGSQRSGASIQPEIFTVSPTIPEETSLMSIGDRDNSQAKETTKASCRVSIHTVPLLKGWVRQWKLQASQNDEVSTQKSATLQKEMHSFIPDETLREITKEAIHIVEEVARAYRWELGSTNRLTLLAESHLKQLKLNLNTD